jgi:hypothetical protein
VKNRWYTYAIGLLVAVVLVMSFCHLTRDIRDNDFFWHLKSGQWIWESKALPESDPFAYTTPMLESGRARFLLNSYWLSQVFFYVFYLAWGMPGIVISRFLIAGVLCFVLLKLRKGDKLLYLSLLAIFFALILRSYPLERPHLFSFIFFALVLFFLERIKAGQEERAVLLFLPFSMLIWANMHGGYALGIVIILLYILMEGLKFSHPVLSPLSGKSYKRLLLAGAAAIAISFVNPGTYHVFSKAVLFQPQKVIFDNLEFQSTLSIFRIYGDYSILIYWSILACAVMALLIDVRRPDLTKIALIAGTGYFSFTTLRYVAFFLIAALPVIGEAFSRLRFLKAIRGILYLAALAITISFAVPYTGLETLKSGEWVDSRKFPVRAVDFIEQNDIKGNMYNYFNWGGYLIWRLGPGKKVFIDGRTLDSEVYEQTTYIDKAVVDGQSGEPFWKYLLEKHQVNYIIVPSPRKGWRIPLFEALATDRDWVPVFFDRTAALFIKNSALNSDILQKYSSTEE